MTLFEVAREITRRLASVFLRDRRITLRGAIFISIGSMVGAGILALFEEAGGIIIGSCAVMIES
jgi:hypothetical protein